MSEEEKLYHWMLKYGYNHVQIKEIFKRTNIKNINDSDLPLRVKRLNYYLFIIGYKKKEIIKITHLVPTIYNSDL